MAKQTIIIILLLAIVTFGVYMSLTGQNTLSVAPTSCENQKAEVVYDKSCNTNTECQTYLADLGAPLESAANGFCRENKCYASIPKCIGETQ